MDGQNDGSSIERGRERQRDEEIEKASEMDSQHKCEG